MRNKHEEYSTARSNEHTREHDIDCDLNTIDAINGHSLLTHQEQINALIYNEHTIEAKKIYSHYKNFCRMYNIQNIMTEEQLHEACLRYGIAKRFKDDAVVYERW